MQAPASFSRSSRCATPAARSFPVRQVSAAAALSRMSISKRASKATRGPSSGDGDPRFPRDRSTDDVPNKQKPPNLSAEPIMSVQPADPLATPAHVPSAERRSARDAILPEHELGLPAEALPRHVAIIMDGNGRWARAREMPRSKGHEAGVTTAKRIITHSGQLGIDYLTLYSFSSENWKRPADEVAALMRLYAYHLVEQRGDLMANNVRLRQIGRLDGLPRDVIDRLQETEQLTASNTGLTLQLALNYGSRAEIVDAVRAIAREVQSGDLDPAAISEAEIADRLYTQGAPDPDLLIRTAGEMRISNFLLWQISYSELYVSDVYWPDFGPQALNEALRVFAGRSRRFGDVVAKQNSCPRDSGADQ